jgi:hypothetical protein
VLIFVRGDAKAGAGTASVSTALFVLLRERGISSASGAASLLRPLRMLCITRGEDEQPAEEPRSRGAEELRATSYKLWSAVPADGGPSHANLHPIPDQLIHPRRQGALGEQ